MPLATARRRAVLEWLQLQADGTKKPADALVFSDETGEPLGPPTFWARDPRFSDTSGWSNRPSRDGGIIYVQGPAQNHSTYLRVIPDWVRQMRAAVDAAGR